MYLNARINDETILHNFILHLFNILDRILNSDIPIFPLPIIIYQLFDVLITYLEIIGIIYLVMSYIRKR